VDLKMNDAKIQSLIGEVKATEAEMTRQEEKKTKDFEMINARLA
jgi:hypothetical protein